MELHLKRPRVASAELAATGASPGKTRSLFWVALGLAAGVALTPGNVSASDALLDLLINKGMITEREAATVKAEVEANRTNETSAILPRAAARGKTGLPGMELYGDLRLRFESRDATDPYGGKIGLDRFRYSARVGLRGEILDGGYYGVRLDTSSNPRSAWVSLGTSTSGGTYQGPFGKSTAGINLGQLFLGWRPTEWLDLTAGKMANPLYTTPLLWDSDLAPEGFSERFKYTVGAADLFASFGQFLYQDVNPTTASKGFFNLNYNSANLPFLLAWQGGVKYHLTKDITLKVAPTLYQYTSHGVNQLPSNPPENPGFAGVFIGQGSTNGIDGSTRAGYSGYPGGPYDGFVVNQTGINDLKVLDFPVELTVRWDDLNFRLSGEIAQNLTGAERARAAYAAQNSPLFSSSGLLPISSPQTHDVRAFRAALAVNNQAGPEGGPISKRREWEATAGWQHVEQYALDPNLLDSDFFEGRANLEGVFVGLTYGLTDSLTGAFRYAYAWRINDKLGTGGVNSDLPQMNPIDRYHLFQLDLSLKF